jgi:transcriptional regulator of acetoin/glycerol metabolism
MMGNRSGMTGNGSGMTGNVTPGLTGGLPRGGAEEERLVREAMERCNGNISAAAKALGISRPTLYAKLKKFGL